MPQPYPYEYQPWAMMRRREIGWLGMARDEAHAWQIALGWPGPEEIREAKLDRWRVVRVDIKEGK